MSQKALANIALAIFVVIIFVGVAAYLVINLPWSPPTPAPDQTPEPVACAQDVMQCSDGFYVSRIAPRCEFISCPTPAPAPKPIPPPLPKPDETKIYLHEGQKEGHLLVEKIYADYITGLSFREYPVARLEGSPITLRIGESVSNGCTITLTLVAIAGNVAIFTEKTDTNRPCPICLAENTLIDTPYGAMPVQDMHEGAVVWTVDGSGARISAPIIATIRTPVLATHRVVHVVLHDGRELFVSPNHPTADGRLIGDLATGDTLDKSRVIAADKILYRKPFTYDILPSGATGYYWAGGILIKSTLAPAP